MNLQKGRSGDGVPVASPMIKSAMERKKKEVEIVGIAYLFMWGSSQFIGFGSQIFVLILGIIYVFPY